LRLFLVEEIKVHVFIMNVVIINVVIIFAVHLQASRPPPPSQPPRRSAQLSARVGGRRRWLSFEDPAD
jgi:hypothetical protein